MKTQTWLVSVSVEHISFMVCTTYWIPKGQVQGPDQSTSKLPSKQWTQVHFAGKGHNRVELNLGYNDDVFGTWLEKRIHAPQCSLKFQDTQIRQALDCIFIMQYFQFGVM